VNGCLADLAAALVDGELDHAARERAQRHLLHCDACRAEVDAQRRLKARLRGVGEPAPPDALTARLLGLPTTAPLVAPDDVAVRPSPLPPSRPAARPVSDRPAARASAPARPAGRRRRLLARRSAAGSAVAVLGVAAALALGSPPQRPASTPVDPASDAFVTEFVSTTSDGVSGPLTPVRAGVGATFVPLTRGALLSSGGDRGGR
jgi:anti-sigma factor RsiW